MGISVFNGEGSIRSRLGGRQRRQIALVTSILIFSGSG
jgi:hypothetical protein